MHLSRKCFVFYIAPRSDASAAERAPERASQIAVVCALGGGITGTLVSNEHESRCLWMVNWLPCAHSEGRLNLMNAIHQVHLNTLLSEAEVCCATLYPKLSSFFRAPPVAAGRRGGR